MVAFDQVQLAEDGGTLEVVGQFIYTLHTALSIVKQPDDSSLSLPSSPV